MSIDRASGSDSSYLVDVVDRVLDKGIVIDASIRISLGGIDLITIEAVLVVESIDTHLTHGAVWNRQGPASRQALTRRLSAG